MARHTSSSQCRARGSKVVHGKPTRKPGSKPCPHRPQSRREVRLYSEETLAEACAAIDANPGVSYQAIADQFGIPESTLRARHKGVHSSRSVSHAAQQLLTPEEEEALCDWLEHLSYEGIPADKETVFDMVKSITGSTKPPNVKWVRRFLARHPHILLGRPYGLSPERARAFNRSTVDDYFKQLKAILDKYKIPWEHVYNMDEKGVQRGGKGRIKRIKYFVPRGRRTNYKLRSSNLELITIVECVCADGSNIQPGFIFAGKEFTRDMFEDVDPQVCIALSPSGWTAEYLCLEWFQQCFIPQANAHRVSDAPILLILDGHNSHVTPEMRDLAIKNNVHLFLLPPHTTHRLQPLDVGVFASLENAWQVHCNAFFKISKGDEMDRGEFIRQYSSVRNQVFTEDLIRKAWFRSGITSGQFSADIFTDHDYAPSHATSILAHVPPSYPTKDPLFPENASTVAAADIDNTSSNEEDVTSEQRAESDTLALHSLPPSESQILSTAEERAALRDRARSLRRNLSISSAGGHTSSGSPAITRSSHHCLHPCPECHSHLSALEEHVSTLEEEVGDLYARYWHAEAHSKLAELRIGDLQQQLNRVTQKRQRKRRPLRTEAVLLTAGKGLEMSQQQEAEERAEAEHRAAEQARKAREEAQRQTQRVQIAGDSHSKFAGALSRKVKDDLKDIAYALGLPLGGTNSELVSSITAFLNTHPEHATNPKFAGLFIPANGLPTNSDPSGTVPRDARRRKRDLPSDLNDENVPPPSQRPRTSPPDRDPPNLDTHLSHIPFTQSPAPLPISDMHNSSRSSLAPTQPWQPQAPPALSEPLTQGTWHPSTVPNTSPYDVHTLKPPLHTYHY